MYPEQDVSVASDSVIDSPHSEIDLLRYVYATSDFPCLISFYQSGLLTAAVQFGLSCTLQTGKQHNLTFSAIPEGALRPAKNLKNTIRPGLMLGLTQSLNLSPENRSRVLFGSIQYKYIPLEFNAPQLLYANGRQTPYSILKWLDVLQTSFSFGIIRNFDEVNPWAIKFQYQETLPLGMRRLGGLSESAALQIKTISINSKIELSPWFFGGGIGYAIVLFDAIRIALPYPELNIGLRW